MMSPDAQLVAASKSTGEPNKGHVHHLFDLPLDERKRLYGRAEIDMPNAIVAGEPVTIAFHFILGKTPWQPNARLRIAWRWPFDWANLQQNDPNTPNHLTVQSPEHVHIQTQYEPRGGLNPWHHDIDLHVTQGTLSQGDIITLTLTNWQSPTFATSDGYFLFLINPDNSNQWIRLIDPPRFTITAGPPHRLIAIAPAEVAVGETHTVRVRAIDAWENATPIAAPILHGEGIQVGTPGLNPNYPVWEYPVTYTIPGICELHAESDPLKTQSNPTRIHANAPKHRIYWGDIHAGQSEIGCGAGTLDHHYAYARDVAALQFTSQQANDHYITGTLWEHIRQITPKYNAEGHFIAFLGCEWSPLTPDGGDRNVLYRSDEPELRRSDRFFTEHNPDPEPDLRRAPEFLNAFKHKNVLLNLHVGGRPTNLDYHAPEIEPLFEIHSTHATSEWFVFDAIQHGYKVGITAGTDGVMGRPGACGPGRRVTRNVHNGLTAVTAHALTQDALFSAFFNRHCYGTTGARILLDVHIQNHPMGSVITLNESPTITVEVHGTAPIERIDFFKDTKIISTWQTQQYDPNRLRVLWGGAKTQGTAADQRLFWNGHLQIDSGTLLDIHPIAWQSPLDTVCQTNNTQITWTSATAGNDMGFTFTPKVEPSTRFHFWSEPCTFSCTFSQMQRVALVVDAGETNRRVEIGPAPCKNNPKSVTLSFTDYTPLTDEHAYWVRITQNDRHRAWSSPIYVTQ